MTSSVLRIFIEVSRITERERREGGRWQEGEGRRDGAQARARAALPPFQLAKENVEAHLNRNLAPIFWRRDTGSLQRSSSPEVPSSRPTACAHTQVCQPATQVACGCFPCACVCRPLRRPPTPASAALRAPREAAGKSTPESLQACSSPCWNSRVRVRVRRTCTHAGGVRVQQAGRPFGCRIAPDR